jgi:hypothetical protein
VSQSTHDNQSILLGSDRVELGYILEVSDERHAQVGERQDKIPRGAGAGRGQQFSYRVSVSVH